MSNSPLKPRNFFLNQAHELARTARDGGGGPPKLDMNINWATKAASLLNDFRKVRTTIEHSIDPLRNHRYYFLASPEASITKKTENQQNNRKGITSISVPVDYRGNDSRVVQRLGFDLIYVTEKGQAVIHVVPLDLARIENSLRSIDQLGILEKIRWAYLQGFDVIPWDNKINPGWIRSIESRKSPTDAIIQLHPLMNRTEAEEVILQIQIQLNKKANEQFISGGMDYSGRRWVRGVFSPQTLLHFAERYYSIQSITAPASTPLSVNTKKPSTVAASHRTIPQSGKKALGQLPIVGILDAGVPKDHPTLAEYCVGSFVHPDNLVTEPTCEHGSITASRTVFGAVDFSSGMDMDSLSPECRFIDINVADVSLDEDLKIINDQIVLPSIDACLGQSTFKDVRVFNMSFSDHKPLALHQETDKRQRMFTIQDLDNLIFARDIIVIAAAGNTDQGVQPTTAYPNNYLDPAWGLGHWASSFNSLTCGSFASRVAPNGICKISGAPSPFCKVAPGVANSLKPDFSAPGGDFTEDYRFKAGLGEWAVTDKNDWADFSGTSLAAPLLARQCAIAFQLLKNHCASDVQPFGVTVKAILALSAHRPTLPENLVELTLRTLGRGVASADLLANPDSNSAVFIWQGVLLDHKEIAKIQIPIPLSWRKDASKPIVEIAVSWDTPTNAAVEKIYGCRKVVVHLRPSIDSDAVQPKRRRSPVGTSDTYPLFTRTYDITDKPRKPYPQHDIWILELYYEQKIMNPAGRAIPPQQRVGIALRLRDDSDRPVSPQSFVQALPISQSMLILGQPNPVLIPARIKT